MKLKICGLRDEENITKILEIGPDYLGFIFYEKSARYARRKLDPYFAQSIQSAETVGVFVNEDSYQIEDTAQTYELDYIQLHGNESPQQCKELQAAGLKLIKVFSVGDSFDFNVLKPYEEWVEYFLFDTKGKLPGGNGYTFDWSQMDNYPSEVPFFLSGGLGPKHRELVQQLSLPKLHALDVNSKFEIRPGLKDVQKLQDFWHHIP